MRMDSISSARFTRIAADGGRVAVARAVPAETPVAIEFGGIGYAVLMATPADLADLVTGFALAERLIERADELVELDCVETGRGIVARAWLTPERAARVMERVRHRISESSCGLCGIENLDQALRPLPTVTAISEATDAAIFAALDRLRDHQPLNRETGAVHAAALCGADGAIRLVREDVGRHNAFDKLIGAMARGGIGWGGGFALLTSRCSYELVEKAALSGCPLLVTLSAPTALAIERARDAGLRLIVLARGDAMLAVPA
jgi:FdhD protein